MKFPFFASCIVFIIWLSYELKKHTRIEKKGMTEFWNKEAKANTIRKKSLADLNYIEIPFSTLPLSVFSDKEQIAELQQALFALEGKKIVNFTGISNTDLKLTYGTANLPLLTEYDQNYIILARVLNQLGNLYYQEGNLQAAREILEFALSTGTDVSGTYKCLAEIYLANQEGEKIASLIQSAEKINGLMKNSIVRTLQELNPCND